MEVQPEESPDPKTQDSPQQLSLADELAQADKEPSETGKSDTSEETETGKCTESKDSKDPMPDLIVEDVSTPVSRDATDKENDNDGDGVTTPEPETSTVANSEKDGAGQPISDDDDTSQSSSIVQLDCPVASESSAEPQANKESKENEAMDVDNGPEIIRVETLSASSPASSQNDKVPDKPDEENKSTDGCEKSSNEPEKQIESTPCIEQADDNASSNLINGGSEDKDVPSASGDENSTSLPADERDPFASSDANMDVDGSTPEKPKTPEPSSAASEQNETVEVNEQGGALNGDVTPGTEVSAQTTLPTTTTTTETTSTAMDLDDDEPGELVIAEKPPAPTEVEVIVPEEHPDASSVAEPTVPTSIVGTISVANLTGRLTATASSDPTDDPSDATSSLEAGSDSSKVLHPRRGSPCKIEDVVPPITEDCTHCNIRGICRKKVTISGTDFYLCSERCVLENRALCKATTGKTLPISVQTSDLDLITKQCSFCQNVIPRAALGCITWEVMEFCNEDCLGKYQSKFTNVCVHCGNDVVPASMGKYCVRFSHEVKQFCSTTCLDTYKKNIKTCSFCQKNLNDSPDSFLAPVRGIDQFKDFCSQDCLEKYDCITNNLGSHLTAQECVVCRKFKIVQFEVIRDQETETLCSEVCLSAYKFVNSIDIGSCSMCNKFYDRKQVEECCVFNGAAPLTFCSQHCMNINVLSKRLILPCAWCKAKKYNFDMVRKKVVNDGKEENLFVCSLNCLALHSVSATQVENSNQADCSQCKKYDYVQYHLTMSDMSIRNFCSYGCVAAFQKPYQSSANTLVQPIPTGTPKRSGMLRPAPLNTLQAPSVAQQQQQSAINNSQDQGSGPMISSVTSLKRLDAPPPLIAATAKPQPAKQLFKYPILIKPRDYVEVKNKMTSCRITGVNKGVSCKPNRVECSTQYDPQEVEGSENPSSDSSTSLEQTTKDPLKALIPVPVPIYVPTPMAMYTLPSPVFLPVPFPVPVPIFVPTTRKTTKGIFKLLKKIHDKLPENPAEADVFMMAAMAAAESTKKSPTADENQAMDEDDNSSTSRLRSDLDESSSSSSDEGDSNDNGKARKKAERKSRKSRRTSNLSCESSLSQNYNDDSRTENGMDSSRLSLISEDSQVTDKSINHTEDSKRNSEDSKEASPPPHGKKRKRGDQVTTTSSDSTPDPEKNKLTLSKKQKLAKDSDMKLKYMLGVNAWKYFVCFKDKSGSGKKLTPDLLTMRPEELNTALALFMREAKMPSGGEFRGDSKYYLLLGIQYYLLEHGRKINIFHDPACEALTDALEEDAIKFNSVFRKWESTRLEEEHLWESKQLGVSSPEVLISTLIYFNTLHFKLLTVEDHQKLSFKTVVKGLKEGDLNSSSSRSSVLRYYPPSDMTEGDSKMKPAYEVEASTNKKRCHVHLYDFYLTKCPEIAKQRGDLFYLLPEAACTSESPVWYSNVAISADHIRKVLNRIKMIKEIKQILKEPK